MSEAKPPSATASVETIDGPGLLEQLDKFYEARDPAQRFVMLSDADGTLWSGDIGMDFLHAGLKARIFRDEVLPYAQAMANEFAIAVRSEIHAQLETFDEAYKVDAVTDEGMVILCAAAFAGLQQSALQQFAAEVVLSLNLESRLHAEVRPIFHWAKERDIPVWVVSASPREVVVEGAKLLGIAEDRIIGVEAHCEQSVRATKLVQPIPYGPGKRQAIEARLTKSRVLAAFGDNYWDTAMLEMAEFPLAIRAKPRLLANAPQLPKLKQLLPQD